MPIPTGVCRNCGEPIRLVRVGYDFTPKWFHEKSRKALCYPMTRATP